MFNFDEVIDRSGLSCAKYETSREAGNDETVIPFTIADMNFATAPEVKAACLKRADRDFYSYTVPSDDVYEAIINWQKDMHELDIKKDWIVFSPGTVPGLDLVIRSIIEDGEKIIIQTPAYPPFFNFSNLKNMEILQNKLIFEDGKYKIDFKDLEEKAKEAKAIVLCNPHNPVGRVWTKSELEKISEIAYKYNLYVISDEMHQDFTFNGNYYTPIMRVFKNYEKVVSFMAPSKTFNIAGLNTAYAIIPDDKLREKINDVSSKSLMGAVNPFGLCALKAAYNDGRAWYKEMIKYLEGNINYVSEEFSKIDKIKFEKPEGTYLIWIDLSDLNCEPKKMHEIFVKNKIFLSDGAMFGDEKSVRINLAYPREIINFLVNSFKKSIEEIKVLN